MHQAKDRTRSSLPKNITVFWLTLCLALLLPQGRAISVESSGGDLRGVYLKHKAKGKSDQLVGRIALRKVQGDNEQLVRLDHRFRSGDEFRIEVSSNRDGWLYMLHRQGNDDPKLLWPEQKNGGVSDGNRVSSGQSYVIPQSGVIKFDVETGTEFFYLAITDKPGAPRLTTQGFKEAAAKKPKKSARKETKNSDQRKEIIAQNQLVQVGVRSIAQSSGNSMRTVIFDPGAQDSDCYLYFAAPEEEGAGLTLIEFRLRHQ